MSDETTPEPDTYLSIPDETGMQAAVIVPLLLDVDKPDLSRLDDLLDADVLQAMARAVVDAQQPYPWAAAHVRHAVDHLLAGEFTHAWPPLVIGVEGLYWGEAEQDGYIDDRGRFTEKAGRGGRARSVIDIIHVLRINERVQRFSKRTAFGGERTRSDTGGFTLWSTSASSA